jgi:hypothetical protein
VIILAGSVGSDAPKQQPERTKIAMTATPIQEPAPAPAPPTPAAGSAAAPAIAVPAPETVAAKPQPKLTPIKPGTTKAPTRTAAITPNKAGSGSAKTPVDTGPITPEEANRRLMVEYQQVNSEINALEKAQGASATQDLWQLYRHISYNAAIQNEAKRRTLTSNLASIRTELAKRKKR